MTFVQQDLRFVRIAICVTLALLLVSCAGNDEQAVRHLVLAELIQREKLPESHVEIRSVRFLSANRAIVDARVMREEGRAAGWHTLHCSVERDSGVGRRERSRSRTPCPRDRGRPVVGL